MTEAAFKGSIQAMDQGQKKTATAPAMALARASNSMPWKMNDML